MNETKSQHSDKDVKSVKTLLSSYDPSHIHKENMAYAGVLLEVGLFAGIMRMEQWPPCYLLQVNRWLLGLGVFVIWLLIHLFIGWQLIQRRTLAKIINAATRYLWGTLPSNKSGEGNTETSQRKKRFCDTQRYICATFFWWSSFTKSDVEIERPKELADLIQEEQPGTWPEELILFLLSIGMLALILLRTCEG